MEIFDITLLCCVWFVSHLAHLIIIKNIMSLKLFLTFLGIVEEAHYEKV